jgi:hypothetical protein
MTSSLETLCKNAQAADDESGRLPEPEPPFDPAKHVSPAIAHELNNILAIIQGYTDRLILKYPEDKSLNSQLKLVCEAARRAAAIIREATPAMLTMPVPNIPASQTEPPMGTKH